LVLYTQKDTIAITRLLVASKCRIDAHPNKIGPVLPDRPNTLGPQAPFSSMLRDEGCRWSTWRRADLHHIKAQSADLSCKPLITFEDQGDNSRDGSQKT